MAHVGAVGAVIGARRAALRRRFEEQVVTRTMADALLLQLYERTPVLLMKVHVGSASLPVSLRNKSLRARLSVESRELFKSQKVKARPSESQCAHYDFNSTVQFIIQGDDVLCFEILQPHTILPSTTLGKCVLSLSEIREAFGSGPLSQTFGQPLMHELLLTVPKKDPEEILGGMQIVIQLERTNLAVVMSDPNLRALLQHGLASEHNPMEDYRVPMQTASLSSTIQRRPIVVGQIPHQQQSTTQGIPVVVGQIPQQQQLQQQQQHQQQEQQQQQQQQQLQTVRTTDGGLMSTRSWVDPSTGVLQYEAVLTDANGNVVERVHWTEN